MISESDVERAVEFLRESAEKAAMARANRIYLESWVKVVLAQQMAEWTDESLGAQERIARCSQEYQDALKGLREAVREDEYHRFKRDAAAALIEAWRTLQANARAEGKAYT